MGKGFGARDCAFNIGINLYLGRRCSVRPRRSPFVLSKDNICSQDFQSQLWPTGFLLLARLKIEQAGNEIQQIAERLNPFYNAFTGPTVCNKRNIYTAGVISNVSGAGNIRPIGFANFPHEDRGDYLHTKAIEYFLNRFLNKTVGGAKNNNNDRKWCMTKLESLQKHTGFLGVPTTCGYQTFKGNKCTKVKHLHARFGMFDFAMPLTNNTVHHFYGWAFRHCTLVPHWLNGEQDKTIHYCNNDDGTDDIVVFAWGRTGGRKETIDEVPEVPRRPTRIIIRPIMDDQEQQKRNQNM